MTAFSALLSLLCMWRRDGDFAELSLVQASVIMTVPVVHQNKELMK